MEKCYLQVWSTQGHPQSNGQVEVTACTLLKIIKAQVERAKGAWVDKLPSVLWAYRTTTKTSTGETPFNLTFISEAKTPLGETPFNLTFESEVVIPIKIRLSNFRTITFDEAKNDEELKINFDLLDESREKARTRMARYHNQIAGYYNGKVKVRKFEEGDLVLRKLS